MSGARRAFADRDVQGAGTGAHSGRLSLESPAQLVFVGSPPLDSRITSSSSGTSLASAGDLALRCCGAEDAPFRGSSLRSGAGRSRVAGSVVSAIGWSSNPTTATRPDPTARTLEHTQSNRGHRVRGDEHAVEIRLALEQEAHRSLAPSWPVVPDLLERGVDRKAQQPRARLGSPAAGQGMLEYGSEPEIVATFRRPEARRWRRRRRRTAAAVGVDVAGPSTLRRPTVDDYRHPPGPRGAPGSGSSPWRAVSATPSMWPAATYCSRRSPPRRTGL